MFILMCSTKNCTKKNFTGNYAEIKIKSIISCEKFFPYKNKIIALLENGFTLYQTTVLLDCNLHKESSYVLFFCFSISFIRSNVEATETIAIGQQNVCA